MDSTHRVNCLSNPAVHETKRLKRKKETLTRAQGGGVVPVVWIQKYFSQVNLSVPWMYFIDDVNTLLSQCWYIKMNLLYCLLSSTLKGRKKSMYTSWLSNSSGFWKFHRSFISKVSHRGMQSFTVVKCEDYFCSS